MVPTDLDVRALYYERVREAEAGRRIHEARRVKAPLSPRATVAKDSRHCAPLHWLLRVVLRARPA
jgi:hypothetical protein